MRNPFKLILAAMMISLGLTAPASAQFGPQAGFNEVFQPDYYRRDMQLIVDYLKIEQWQKPIVEMMLEDYQISFDAGTQACRDEMQNLKEEMMANPENAMQIALRPIQNWEREKELLKLELIENIQTQLSPLQEERWPSLDRAMRREKDLPKGQIPGESMNIFVVLHGMELSPANIQAIDPALLQYEVNLDRALEDRGKTLKKHQKRIQDAMIEKNTEVGLSALRKISESRAMVCAIHFEALEEISRNLPADRAVEFKETVLANGFPELFEDTMVDKVLRTIRLNKTLEPEQITLVDAIESRYLVSLEESNMRMIEGYRIDGKQIPIIEAQRAIARRDKKNTRMARLPDSILQLSRDREEMLERYRQELLNVLSTNQQNSVRTQTRGGRPNASVKGMKSPKGATGKKPKNGNGTDQERGFRPSIPEEKQVPAPPRKDERALPAGNTPR
jgi:hypothetical protein